MRLKTPRTTLIRMSSYRKCYERHKQRSFRQVLLRPAHKYGICETNVCPVSDVNAMIAITTTAPATTTKLLIGPTTAVLMSSHTSFLKLRGSTGVGFAHPNIGKWLNARIAGSRTVPTGSMCLMGFNVTRPSMRAVGSPQREAIQACADSWTLIANKNAMIWKTMSTMFNGVIRSPSILTDWSRKSCCLSCVYSRLHLFGKFTNRS